MLYASNESTIIDPGPAELYLATVEKCHQAKQFEVLVWWMLSHSVNTPCWVVMFGHLSRMSKFPNLWYHVDEVWWTLRMTEFELPYACMYITQTIQCQSYMLTFSFAPSHLDIGHHRPYVSKNQLHPIRQKNDVTFDKWGMAYVPQPSTYPRLFFPFFHVCGSVPTVCLQSEQPTH